MINLGTDTRQTPEVIGTQAFEEFVKKLELEGVSVPTVSTDLPMPVYIEPVRSRIEYNIEIPQNELLYTPNYKNLDSINIDKLPSLKESDLLIDPATFELQLEFATPKVFPAQSRSPQPNSLHPPSVFHRLQWELSEEQDSLAVISLTFIL